MSVRPRTVVHVEARLLPGATNNPTAASCIRRWLHDNFHCLSVDQEITVFDGSDWLSRNLESLVVVEAATAAADADADSTPEILQLDAVELVVHVYRLHADAAASGEQRQQRAIPESALGASTEDGSGPPSAALQVHDLPSRALEGLWESLVFESDVKTRLLRFVSSLLFFAERKVSFTAVSFNRLVLLHGPPGSGKTTLCRALAQKLAIRLSHRFDRCSLVEINAHSLFSKYFSESGKRVGRAFDEIADMCRDEQLFTVVLIDEVETLTAARRAAANGNEPTDGLRVVNALLTALDKLRTRDNVIVLTTSNLPEAMDPAFLDRADIKQYISPPKTEAIYSILRSSLNELIRTGIIIDAKPIPCAAEAALCLYSEPDAPSTRLWRCAAACTDFSGRTLRRLPLVMHALYIRRPQCGVREAVGALERAVADEVEARALLRAAVGAGGRA